MPITKSYRACISPEDYEECCEQDQVPLLRLNELDPNVDSPVIQNSETTSVDGSWYDWRFVVRKFQRSFRIR